MSPARVSALLSKELRYGTRSFIFIFATIIPLVITLVVSLVFGGLLAAPPRLGIVDEGNSQLVALLGESAHIRTRLYPSAADLRRATEAGRVDVGLILPIAFDEAVRQNSGTDMTVLFWGEGLVTNQGAIVTSLAKHIVTLSEREVPVEMGVTHLGQGSIRSWGERLLPLLVLMAMILGGCLVPAASLVDEKAKRTLHALLATPVTLLELSLAKALLGVLLSLTMGALILILNQGFGTQPLLLSFVLSLGALASAVFGILLGLLVRDINGLFTIIKSLALLLYAPAIISLIPQLPQSLARLFPTYYLIEPIVAISQRNSTWAEVAPEVGGLMLIIALLLLGVLGLIGRSRQRLAVLTA